MIYIDELIFLNFIIDYVIISTLSKIIKIKIKKIRLFLSCLFGEISLIYLFVNMNNYLLFLTKILICLGMMYICFGYTNIIKNTVYYYILSFFLGGILYYFKIQKLVSYKYILFLIPLFMNMYKKYEYNIKNFISTKYNVTIYLNNGRILNLKGYMDTGNTLIEPYTNKKVIIINKNINENFYLVPYKTIDNSSLIKCFNPKKVYIDGLGERNDISIGIINKKFNGYDCLLNYKIMEE